MGDHYTAGNKAQTRKPLHHKRGASVINYGLVIGLISVVALVTVTNVGSSVDSLFSDVSDNLENSLPGNQATPEATATATPTPTPTPVNAFYQCHGQSSYIVFAENVNGHTVVSQDSAQPFLDFAQACRDLGFSPLGTGHTSQAEVITSITDEVDALTCHNCNWAPSGNVWTWDNQGAAVGCTAANASMAAGINSGDVLAGYVLAEASGMGSMQLDGDLQNFTGSSSGIPTPGPFLTSGNNGGSGSLSTPGSNDIFYTGTPDFLLCASSSGP